MEVISLAVSEQQHLAKRNAPDASYRTYDIHRILFEPVSKASPPPLTHSKTLRALDSVGLLSIRECSAGGLRYWR